MHPINNRLFPQAEPEILSAPQANRPQNATAVVTRNRSYEEYCAIWDEWEKNSAMGSGEDRDIAVQRLKDCLRRNSIELDLFALSLTSLPELPHHVLWLEISENKLTELPQLPPKLDTLNVCRNRLVSLPALPQTLLSLRASDNELTEFPKTVPPPLIGLDLSYNKLKEIPEAGLNLCSSSAWIDLAHNPISEESLQLLEKCVRDPKFQDTQIYFTSKKE